MAQYTLFQTAFGTAGLCWNQRGITRVAFPQADENAVRDVFAGAEAAAIALADAPAEIKCAAEKISALFEGQEVDFSDIVLDRSAITAFDREVLALTSAIPHGALKTYGDLAIALGDITHSRRVGQALGRNPFPVIIPCHRVVGKDGTMTGFSAPGGAEAKRALLKLEGALEPELFD